MISRTSWIVNQASWKWTCRVVEQWNHWQKNWNSTSRSLTASERTRMWSKFASYSARAISRRKRFRNQLCWSMRSEIATICHLIERSKSISFSTLPSPSMGSDTLLIICKSFLIVACNRQPLHCISGRWMRHAMTKPVCCSLFLSKINLERLCHRERNKRTSEQAAALACLNALKLASNDVTK